MSTDPALNEQPIRNGIAPADARTHPRWPRWKIALAYAILFGVALGSIWMIDDHVLQATPPATLPR